MCTTPRSSWLANIALGACTVEQTITALTVMLQKWAISLALRRLGKGLGYVVGSGTLAI